MSDTYSRALFYDYQTRCEPVDDASGPFWRSCGCCTPGACSCNRKPVLATEIGLAIEDCDGLQIEVTL